MTTGTGATNRTFAAAGAILIYATIIGFTDNYVRVIAAEGGLFTFHALRSAMAVVIFALSARFFGTTLRPRNLRAVAARSAVHGTAILVYFGCLAFLPVAMVAAGLFTAPIFVLLISRFGYGHRVGPFRIAAAAVGFAGIVLVLGPAGGASLSPVAFLPVAAGALYALGNVATREWCADESAAALTFAFFVALGIIGLGGMAVLALADPVVPEGVAGFVFRPPHLPSVAFAFWTFVQAAGSLLGILLMVRAYQMAEASRVAIFEYAVIPMAALWTWVLWDEVLGTRAIIGIMLIFAAGAVMALRGR